MRSAIEQLGTDKYRYVSLQLEPNVSDADTTAYSDEYGFNWTFVNVTPELLKALVEQFDQSIIVPPLTPHFTISPNGKVSALTTGPETPEELVSGLSAISAAG